jgi:hypothetical protein
MSNQTLNTKKRIPFNLFEDDLIKYYVQIFGNHDWNSVAKKLIDRTPRQCRDRYNRYLRSSCKNISWTCEEDDNLSKMIANLGTCWRKLTDHFPGRDESSLKYRWNEHFSQSQTDFSQKDADFTLVDEEIRQLLTEVFD